MIRWYSNTMGFQGTSVRLDPDLQKKIKDLAWRKRTSVSELIRQGVQIMIDQDKQEKK